MSRIKIQETREDLTEPIILKIQVNEVEFTYTEGEIIQICELLNCIYEDTDIEFRILTTITSTFQIRSKISRSFFRNLPFELKQLIEKVQEGSADNIKTILEEISTCIEKLKTEGKYKTIIELNL